MSTLVAPPPEVATDEPITLINAFTVPFEESGSFLERWKESARIMASQPGFIRAQMHRSLLEDTELDFVNVARWASGKLFAQAQANPDWIATVQRMVEDPNLHVTARPGVYEVAIDLHPGDSL